MNRLLSCVAMLPLVVGCPRKTEPDANGSSPTPPGAVKLPDPVSANPISKDRGTVIYLDVNSKGQVVLTPEQSKDVKTKTLDDPKQVEDCLKRKAKSEYLKQTGKSEDPPAIWKSEATVVLRIDKRATFEKTSSIVRACKAAGYTKIELRAFLGTSDSGGGDVNPPAPKDEGEFQTYPDPAAEEPGAYHLAVHADAAGRIAKLTLRDGNDPKTAIDVGTDLQALSKKLKEFATKRKDKPPKLTLAIDAKLLQEHVITLFDASVQAGFTDVSPVLLDPKER